MHRVLPGWFSSFRSICLFPWMCLWLLAACSAPVVVPQIVSTSQVVPTYTPTPPAEAAAESTPVGEAATTEAAPTEAVPLTVALDPLLPERYTAQLMPVLMGTGSVQTETGERPLQVLDRSGNATITLSIAPRTQVAGVSLLERYYAAVVPFATVQDDIDLPALAARWRGEDTGALVLPIDHNAELTALFGPDRGANVVVTELEKVLATLEATPGSIGIVPFDQLHPRYKVLTVDGVNVLSNQFNATAYPLAVSLIAQGEGAATLVNLLAPHIDTPTNRQADALTTLIMTGVTAMSRVTALRMEQNGYTYPAMVISGTLAAADITHISNEVPFLDDCVVNAGLNVLVLCSHTNY